MCVDAACGKRFELPYDFGQTMTTERCGRGRFRTCPYRHRPIIHDPNDSVDMVRHDHKFIQPDMGQMIGQVVPCEMHHFPQFIQHHPTIHHLAKQTFPVLRANGDEIRPRLCVIVPLQPDGTAVVFFRVVGHGCRGFRCTDGKRAWRLPVRGEITCSAPEFGIFRHAKYMCMVPVRQIPSV